MDVAGICIIIAVCGVVVWLPVLLFFPLIRSLANRISGKTVNIDHLKSLQQKVALLEHEVADLRTRQIAVEESQQFAQKMIETIKDKAERSR